MMFTFSKFCCFLSLTFAPGLLTHALATQTSLQLINYNIWHGLGGGFFKREELEPRWHKEKRYEKQIADLTDTSPDILFLQEVNPVGRLTRKIARKLGMSYVFQNTNCGISVFGQGLPMNLNMGIAILVRPPLKIRKIVGLKLSGPLGLCNPFLTFQYAEFRYALFAMAEHPKHGSFLLINTHFHHGVEWSDQVRKQIKAWEDQQVLTFPERQKLEKVIEASNLRRKKELKNLFSHLKQYTHLPIVLAGDFNATVYSPIYKAIVETHQMKDTMQAYSPHPFTWNPLENQNNHKFTEKFDVPVPTFGKKEVSDFFKAYNRQPRRIDYIFVSPHIRTSSFSLYGNQPNSEEIIGSDHFGISVELFFDK